MVSTKEKVPKRTYSQVACIGTGFSGIGVGASLKRWYGITDIQFFDRSSSCAGTWQNNRYPGCACDVPAALYSFSYEQNPNWSRVLAPQPEIKEYLVGVATKYNLIDKMHLNTEVEFCNWNDELQTWFLHLHDIKTGAKWIHESEILFSCVGGLVVPRTLDVPGEKSFQGPIFHTAQWDDSVDLRDKRVVVIGNGCTGTQLVPALINNVGVKSVTHFVRSKHWVFPAIDAAYPKPLRWIFRNIPGVLRLHRFQIWAILEQAWEGFYLTPKGAKVRAEKQSAGEKYMMKEAPEEYLRMLLPDFEVGCKRRIFDTGYMQVLHKPNVDLTDAPIREIVSNGLRTHDGVIEADVILLANGFDLKRPLAPMTITGRHGVDLHQQWRKQGGAGAYSCVAIANFPNMFLVAGPNTATGHTSVVVAAENTTNLALRLLKPIFDRRAITVEPRAEAEKEWTKELQEAMNERIWTQGGCQSWYINEDKWISTVYPYSQTDMWRRCMFPKWLDWQYSKNGTEVKYRGLDRLARPIRWMFLIAGASFISWMLTYGWQHGWRPSTRGFAKNDGGAVWNGSLTMKP